MTHSPTDPTRPFEPPAAGGERPIGVRRPIGLEAQLAMAAAAPTPALVLLGAYGGAWAIDVPISELRHARVLLVATQSTLAIAVLTAVGARLAWRAMARNSLPTPVRGALLGWLTAFVTMLGVTFGGGPDLSQCLPFLGRSEAVAQIVVVFSALAMPWAAWMAWVAAHAPRRPSHPEDSSLEGGARPC